MWPKKKQGGVSGAYIEKGHALCCVVAVVAVVFEASCTISASPFYFDLLVRKAHLVVLCPNHLFTFETFLLFVVFSDFFFLLQTPHLFPLSVSPRVYMYCFLTCLHRIDVLFYFCSLGVCLRL